ncbi:acyl-homoserine-lactone acylase [Arsukibacterium ikkense]|uniref:Acyl-homoserine-lactone acylase n=1 Tax=Arsukibacterium ikkense TaxID=336831 RepID=A0A0M2V413_9GAMM|nr:penicillin acylase family protein [Arsukibacterium ikkense]KKO45129.1 acyl-homoserine-lactone acylase [Arsukibacterium ikkense]
MRISFPLPAITLITASLVLAGCNSATPEPAPEQEQVSITYTSYGVPHISATSYRGMGYGVGYSQAAENLCTLAEQITKLKSEQARFFGPGPGQQFVLSDLGYKGLRLTERASELLSSLPDNASATLHGYVAGFNQRLSEFASPAAYPSPCRNAAWVAPITATELLAYHLDLALLASSRNFISAMAAAQPPGNDTGYQLTLDASRIFNANGLGSNGWALGPERSLGANASILANPHFPWDGELRFFEQHLTIAGELDVTGVSMIGMPAVLIGFNQQLGWTHTVSQGKRFTLYQLELDPANPLRYRYGDSYRDIEQTEVSIEVQLADGSLQLINHTLYRSHFGPLVNLASIDPSLGWNSQSAIAIKDANQNNSRMLQQWLALNKASDTTSFFAALAEHQGIPWVNTLLASSEGKASYVDASQVPRLAGPVDAMLKVAVQQPPLSLLWQDGDGSLLLPGNDPMFEWQDSGHTIAPGLVPLAEAPQLSRNDYVFNANSSHWLSHLTARLQGYPLVYGPEQTIRSPRTRYNGLLLNSDWVADSEYKFDLAALKQVFNHNGSLFGQLFVADIVSRCQAAPPLQLPGQTVNLAAACQTLAAWDGQYQLHSQGAQLMREFLASFRIPSHRALADVLYASGFDSNDPLGTPAGIAPATAVAEQDPVLLALASAMQRLQQAGIALNAPLNEVQYLIKAQQQAPIAIAGGYSFEGAFNMAEGVSGSRSTSKLATVITGQGRPDSPLLTLSEDNLRADAYRLNYGSSFVMALQFTEAGPQAEMLLAYSQSHDPESVHFADQTAMFSQQQWRPMRFSAADIAADQVSQLLLTVPNPD